MWGFDIFINNELKYIMSEGQELILNEQLEAVENEGLPIYTFSAADQRAVSETEVNFRFT